MEVRIEPNDKVAAFNRLLDDLFLAFRISKDVERTKIIYKETLTDIYSLLSYEELLEIKKKIIFNYDWMPKVKELKEFANRYVSKKSEPTPVKVEEVLFEDVDYKELNMVEARKAFVNSLEPFFHVKSLEDVFDCFDLYFRGFIQEDFDLFANKIAMSDGNISTQRILDFFSWLRTNRQEPRLIKLRSAKKKVWQDLQPSVDIQKRHKEIIKKLTGKNFPEPRRKDVHSI